MPTKKRSVSFDTLVKMFIRDYNIPTKKDIEKLTARMDRLEQLLRQMLEEDDHRGIQRRKTPSRSPGKDTEIVLRTIAESEDGATIPEILQQTGFDEKKLRNILYRLHKKGAIRRLNRGVYAPGE